MTKCHLTICETKGKERRMRHMRYYWLRPQFAMPGKWVLGNIGHVDNWLFRHPPAEFMEPCTYTLDVLHDGAERDYSVAGYASVPVLSKRAYEALAGLPEVDEPYHHVVLEPVRIANKAVSQDYFVMVIETQVDCIDEQRSAFERFAVDDPVRPDLAGQYSYFFRLVIDPSKTGGRHIFRVKDYLGAIIVSEEVKRRFEAAGLVGLVFDSVDAD
ncbi:imm11 family protein [Pseudomonas tolaasii]|uniref:imm11 family protein n=1 Tax=Pseudomonas tolaasii TaxID=29442 RepID=UPI003530734B